MPMENKAGKKPLQMDFNTRLCSKVSKCLQHKLSSYKNTIGMKLILGSINRVNDVKTGTLIGVDKYGNKYYEDKKNYFFGESRRC